MSDLEVSLEDGEREEAHVSRVQGRITRCELMVAGVTGGGGGVCSVSVLCTLSLGPTGSPGMQGGREEVSGGEITSSSYRLTGGHSGEGSVVLGWRIPGLLPSSQVHCAVRGGQEGSGLERREAS